MNFIDKIKAARTALEDLQRLSVRALGRQLELDGDELDEIVEELVDVQQVARLDGKVLVWTGQSPSQDPAAPEHPDSGVMGARPNPNYTPKHLADKILASRSAMEGEKKQVTVLFCDVAGSMDLADTLGPEAWHQTLNHFFEVLTSAVHEFEGTVNQYTGDGIMALFGAPIAAEDHARRACMAALAIQERLFPLRSKVEAEHGAQFAARIGINSGEVVVGKIGDDLRMDYTAQGQVVGIAARLEALAPSNSILLSAYTERLVGGYFDLASQGAKTVKGLKHALEVFQLGSSQAETTRFDVSRRQGLTKFIGREADMATLQAALGQSQAGNGQVVGVVAEAGTGKSRLCYEFLETCRAQGMTVLEGHAQSHAKNIPLLPMMQVFRAYYGITEEDDNRTAREKIAGRLVLLDEKFKDLLPLQFEFFGIAEPDAPPVPMAPEAKQRQLINVLRQIVQGSDPNIGNIIAYIEDLHWLDDGSEVFLEEWVDALAGSSSFLLVNFRPEYRAEWMQKPWYRQIPLAPLSADEVQQMLVALLGPEPSVSGLAELIFQRTGGNPFFCEEVVKSLQESGVLTGQIGRYVLADSAAELDIPASVHAVLAARIDRLSGDQKTVLQTASVIGRVFQRSLLERVTNLPEATLDSCLAALKAGEFVFQRSQHAGVEYIFKHALTQEVALNSQLSDKLEATHGAVATALEQLHAEHLDEQAALIAHHWEAAGLAMTAARWHGRAADAAAQSNIMQSISHCMAIIRLTKGLANTEEEKQIRLRGLNGFTMQGAWRIQLPENESDALVEETCAIARSLGDADMEFMALGTYGYSCALHRGNLRRSLELMQQAVDMMSGIDNLVTLVGRHTAFTYILFTAGQLERTQELTVSGIEKACGDYDLGIAQFGLSLLLAAEQQLFRVMGQRGQLAAAQAGISQLVEGAMREINLPDDTAWTVQVAIETIYLMGMASSEPRATTALSQLEHAARLHEGNGSDFGTATFMLGHVQAALIRGDSAEAKSRAESALEFIKTHKNTLERESQFLAILSEAQRRSGELDSARNTANEGLALAQRQGARLFEIHCHLAMARVLLVLPGAVAKTETREHLDAAMQLVEDTDARAFAPQIIEERGRLAAALGDADSARTELQAAHQLYVKIGADGHAQRLAAELSL